MVADISHFGVTIDFANGRLDGSSYRPLNFESLWNLLEVCVLEDRSFVFFEIEGLIDKNIQVYFNGENVFCFIHEYETGDILLFSEPVYKTGDKLETIEDSRWGLIYFLPHNQMIDFEKFKMTIYHILNDKNNFPFHHFTQKIEDLGLEQQ